MTDITPKEGELWKVVQKSYSWPVGPIYPIDEKEISNLRGSPMNDKSRFVQPGAIALVLPRDKMPKSARNEGFYLFLIEERLLMFPPEYFGSGHLLEHLVRIL
jgi:hypothetical protein